MLDFVSRLFQFGSATAILDEAGSVSYGELAQLVSQRAQVIREQAGVPRPLVLQLISNDRVSIVDYLACLHANAAVLLLHPDISADLLRAYQSRFSPNVTIRDGHLISAHTRPHDLADDLQVLLSTSGSTGAGKCVALSSHNLQANAQSIVEYLPIEPSDRTLLSLPLSYSYGLSVLHTHLLKGACVVLTRLTVMDKGWWSLIEQTPIHSLAGVPHWYEMMIRLGMTKQPLPELRYFTQAGGKLSPRFALALSDYADSKGISFFPMYGQTEATARMAYLSPERVKDKPECIGQAIAGGQFRLRDENGQLIEQAQCEGVLEYQGPNVMLGYANTVSELAQFNPIDWLVTGDLAVRDQQGDYQITGRIKRIAKLFGERINLDELDKQLTELGYQAMSIGNDREIVIATTHTELTYNDIKGILPFSPRVIRILPLDILPTSVNGKPDYANLTRLIQERK